ncbi:hypothetical protein RB195_012690 [Necator americanus]|uniref:Uncharacterized protein n=1 Tax=Necator americanus TaxID=51031 RepID=A0ABR1DSW4_NECAM
MKSQGSPLLMLSKPSREATLSGFIMATKTTPGNSQFKKPPLYAARGSRPEEGTAVMFTISSSVRLTDIVVAPKSYTGSNHCLLRERFSFTRKGE